MQWDVWGFNFGYQGIGYTTEVSDQYAVREGDDKKWNIDDISNALSECEEAMKDIENNISLSTNQTPDDKQNMLQTLSIS